MAKSGKLVSARRGKIATDSGAAESVMPKGLLANEPARGVQSEASQCEVRGGERGQDGEFR